MSEPNPNHRLSATLQIGLDHLNPLSRSSLPGGFDLESTWANGPQDLGVGCVVPESPAIPSS
jgi:hypothetical protein